VAYPFLKRELRRVNNAMICRPSGAITNFQLYLSSSRVAVFMDHFDKRFQIAARSASCRIIAIASAHHRLNYIHPFPDGNGRVSRLMSHAMALDLPPETSLSLM
jgi:Fic family protein